MKQRYWQPRLPGMEPDPQERAEIARRQSAARPLGLLATDPARYLTDESFEALLDADPSQPFTATYNIADGTRQIVLSPEWVATILGNILEDVPEGN